MTDTVERLLDWSEHDEGKINDTREEAAAEITRLRFEEDWYLGAIAEHLRVVKDGEITRLIINQPPRTSKSSMLATSVGGTLTGEGGSIIIIDDPHNAVEAESETVRTSTLEWFDNSLSTRLNNPRTGASILAMQRLHEGDLTGHILSSDAHDD